MKKVVINILLCLCLFGCAGVQKPTPEQLANADYGKFPENAKELTIKYISSNLIDPYSAVFSGWQGPSKGWYADYWGKNRSYGYRVCVQVNAKNKMGGYTGQKLHFIFFRDGNIIAYEGGDYRSGTMGEQRVYELCSGIYIK